MNRFLVYIISVLLIVFNVYAQTKSFDKINSDKPQSDAELMMQQYDFNQDGKITEKEFIIGDGDSCYRAHLSNVYKILDLKDRDNIKEQQYWFVEIIDSSKYQADLKKYFAYMDKDGDGYISTKDYQNTFKGTHISKSAEKYAEILDADNDQKISFDEYVNFDFTSMPSGSHEVFHNFDTNGDSFLTADEFENVFGYFKMQW